jgi:DNA-binding HxlR family transcriptional regulator
MQTNNKRSIKLRKSINCCKCVWDFYGDGLFDKLDKCLKKMLRQRLRAEQKRELKNKEIYND